MSQKKFLNRYAKPRFSFITQKFLSKSKKKINTPCINCRIKKRRMKTKKNKKNTTHLKSTDNKKNKKIFIFFAKKLDMVFQISLSLTKLLTTILNPDNNNSIIIPITKGITFFLFTRNIISKLFNIKRASFASIKSIYRINGYK